MTTDEHFVSWINNSIRNNYICNEGVEKLKYANTDRDIVRVICDSFACDFIAKNITKNVQLPIDNFVSRCNNYINGNCIYDYPGGFTSEIYVKYDGDILLRATLTQVIMCNSNIHVKNRSISKIILCSSSCHISVEDGSRCIVESYGDNKITHEGNVIVKWMK